MKLLTSRLGIELLGFGVFRILIVVPMLFTPLVRAAPGDFDATFGQQGMVKLGINNVIDFASTVSLQPDGKILVGGARRENVPVGWVARLDENGALDKSFGINGFVTSPHFDDYSALIPLPNGGFFAAGAGTGGSSVTSARYDSRGREDPTYRRSFVGINSGVTLNSATLTMDGSAILAGGMRADNPQDTWDGFVIKLSPNGLVDRSFGGGDGIVVPRARLNPEATSPNIVTDVQVRENGSIVLAGTAFDSPANKVRFFSLQALDSTGNPDQSFADKGTSLTPVSYNFRSGIHLQPDGKILAAGLQQNHIDVLARWNENGTPDSSFGVNGKVKTIASGTVFPRIEDLPNGNIAVTGPIGRDIYAGLFDGEGRPIEQSFFPTFAGQSNFVDIQQAVFQPDGKIVAVGRFAAIPPNGTGEWAFTNDPLIIRTEAFPFLVIPEPSCFVLCAFAITLFASHRGRPKRA
jgi:uncharacterized delta-60 repeat protein